MKAHVTAYLATAAAFFPLDFLWLGLVAREFYRSRLGPLLLQPFNMPAAVGFYAVYVVGIVIFAVAPALAAGSWRTALVYGGLFGFFCYATYDMTNLATLKGFPVSVAAVDIVWGTVLTATAATIGYAITRAVLD